MPTAFVVLALASLAGAMAMVAVFQKDQRNRTVSVRDGLLQVGMQEILLREVKRVTVAPLYDVGPADDLWSFAGDNDREVTFFNRDPGAADSLLLLEGALSGFSAERALQVARTESTFESPVAVWPVKESCARSRA